VLSHTMLVGAKDFFVLELLNLGRVELASFLSHLILHLYGTNLNYASQARRLNYLNMDQWETILTKHFVCHLIIVTIEYNLNYS